MEEEKLKRMAIETEKRRPSQRQLEVWEEIDKEYHFLLYARERAMETSARTSRRSIPS